MEISISMIKKAIEELTPTRIANEMGIAISTVWRWKEADEIPGKGGAKRWREEQFHAAVKKLRKQKASAGRAA
jgi:hypothetical protein